MQISTAHLASFLALVVGLKVAHATYDEDPPRLVRANSTFSKYRTGGFLALETDPACLVPEVREL